MSLYDDNYGIAFFCFLTYDLRAYASQHVPDDC